MNPLGLLLGGGLTAPIEAIGNVLDKLFTSDDEKLDKKSLMLKLAQEPYLAQIELNKVEAQHRSIFVAGWRPAIGWTCATALFYHFIAHPLFSWGVAMWAHDVIPPPSLDMAPLMTLVVSLLGLGAYRTVEKLSGRAK